jgi:predicted protein tyrosine phosphatase
MAQFFISSKSKVRSKAKHVGATHLVSILDPMASRVRRPSLIDPRHMLVRVFDDIDLPDAPAGPTMLDAESILFFGKHSIAPDSVCLVHCTAGVSRSTCAAFALWVQHHGPKRLDEGRAWLAKEQPMACPNRLLAEMFDYLLGMGGAFLNQCEEIAQEHINRILA